MSHSLSSAARTAEPTTEIVEGEVLAPSTELVDPDLGASTVEYAIVLLAAAAFGGVMAAVISSDSVSDLIMKIIEKALSF